MATFSLLRIPTETRSLPGVSKREDLPPWSDTWSLCVVFVRATLILIAVFVGAARPPNNSCTRAAGACFVPRCVLRRLNEFGLARQDQPMGAGITPPSV